MKGYTVNALSGYKLAKAIRLTRLLTRDCVPKLTADVTNIHDTLKTYMLKTCLFIIHQCLPDPKVQLPPEQWAVLIYQQLLIFIHAGELPILFDSMANDDNASVFNCPHDLQFILDNEDQRAACGDNRLNIFFLAEHLMQLLRHYCVKKRVNCVAVKLRAYQHDAELLTERFPGLAMPATNKS